jgi:hypothetical protein
MYDHHELPERINPAGMARMLQMSPARLYQLMKEGIFPTTSRDAEDRPYFTREKQVQMLTVYKTNVGINGRSIFFRPKASRTPPPRRTKGNSLPREDYGQLLATIRAMGMSHVKKSDLENALSALFPNGRLPEDRTALVRQVFVHLHRQESGEKQGQ